LNREQLVGVPLIESNRIDERIDATAQSVF
jgi:hypothetical protein